MIVGRKVYLVWRLVSWIGNGSAAYDTEYLLKDESDEHDAILLPENHPLLN